MSTEKYIPRPEKNYKEKIVPAMKEEFGYSTVMQLSLIHI